MFGIMYTLPKTNLSPDHIGYPKSKFIFQPLGNWGYFTSISGVMGPYFIITGFGKPTLYSNVSTEQTESSTWMSQEVRISGLQPQYTPIYK